MKFIRYRKPSLSTLLGITKAKKNIKKELGIYKVTKVVNAPKNFERRIRRNIGYYSAPMKILRNGLPKPGGGCLITLFICFSLLLLNIYLIIGIFK